MQTIEMLKSLCQANGVSGAEENALAVAEQLCEGLGACHRTVHKSLVCQVMPPQQGRPHLLLDAHIDEIGLVVTYIEEGGFLRVGQAGGVDRRLVMGSPVVVHAKSGDIPGVVGSVPPHIQSGEKKNPQIDEIWIDTGLDEKEVREQIDLGDSISFVGPFTQLLGGSKTIGYKPYIWAGNIIYHKFSGSTGINKNKISRYNYLCCISCYLQLFFSANSAP